MWVALTWTSERTRELLRGGVHKRLFIASVDLLMPLNALSASSRMRVASRASASDMRASRYSSPFLCPSTTSIKAPLRSGGVEQWEVAGFWMRQLSPVPLPRAGWQFQAVSRHFATEHLQAACSPLEVHDVNWVLGQPAPVLHFASEKAELWRHHCQAGLAREANPRDGLHPQNCKDGDAQGWQVKDGQVGQASLQASAPQQQKARQSCRLPCTSVVSLPASSSVPLTESKLTTMHGLLAAAVVRHRAAMLTVFHDCSTAATTVEPGRVTALRAREGGVCAC